MRSFSRLSHMSCVCLLMFNKFSLFFLHIFIESNCGALANLSEYKVASQATGDNLKLSNLLMSLWLETEMRSHSRIKVLRSHDDLFFPLLSLLSLCCYFVQNQSSTSLNFQFSHTLIVVVCEHTNIKLISHSFVDVKGLSIVSSWRRGQQRFDMYIICALLRYGKSRLHSHTNVLKLRWRSLIGWAGARPVRTFSSD